jgi:mRNA interferase HigB
MRVLGRDKLVNFYNKHANAKTALESWFHEAEKANWKTSHDIRKQYRSADFISGNRVIFNIKGNHYRLVVMVRYQSGNVLIEDVMTHADYDKRRF